MTCCSRSHRRDISRSRRDYWPVNDHVRQRMARLRGRRDDLGVIAVREHRSSPPWPRLSFADGCIEVLGRRDLEALHADSERALVIGLDQQMDVIVLDAQLHDAEVLAARRRQRGLSNRLVGTAATKLPD